MVKRVSAFVLVLFLLASTLIVMPRTALAEKPTLNVVALGDSFTAGNGTGRQHIFGPSDCYRTPYNYAQQLVNRYSAEYDVRYSNLACAGATTASISGQVGEDPSAVTNADLVLLSIGGNDAEFSKIISACEIPFSITAPTCKTLIDTVWYTYQDIIGQVRDELSYISSVVPAGAQIVLVGYPQLYADCDRRVLIRSTLSGQLTEYFVSSEMRQLQDFVESKTDQMVQALDGETEHVNIDYVSLHDLYHTHEVCGSAEDWIHDVLSTLSIDDYFHPNQQGHAATADLLYGLNIVPVAPSAPAPQPPPPNPPASDESSYEYLPLACGVRVSHASTYDTFGGLEHGLALDFPMAEGTQVVAPHNGTVFVHFDTDGYGRFVDLVADNGYTYRFAHLQTDVAVSHGQRVGRGEVLGYVGLTGFTTGPHLHMEQLGASGQVEIDLGGPALQWGQRQDSSGYRQTTHALTSENCTSPPAANPHHGQFADLFVHEYNSLRFAPSDGSIASSWQVAFEGISTPTDADACDFDGDGWDEYLSYEKRSSNNTAIMMANPDGDGDFVWTEVVRLGPDTDKITCGDWNGDGKDDLLVHTTEGTIYWGRSNGHVVDRWKVVLDGIGSQTHWDMCDINGDGMQDLVAYEAWASQIMVGTRNSDFTMSWRNVLSGVHDAGGFTCGRFTSYDHDEMIVWMPMRGGGGMYRLLRLNSDYSRRNWDVLQPTGFGRPHYGEIVSGDIDGDGFDEFVVNEFRSGRGNNSIMVGDFNSPRGFSWYPFIEGIRPRFIAVGNFVE